MSTTQERLKEERKRLGLSQEAFARLGGVQKRTQINYEKGMRTPDAAYLQSIAGSGVDVRYVVTGDRMTPGEREQQRRLNAVADASMRAGRIEGLSDTQRAQVLKEVFEASVQGLSEDEQRLIHHYQAAGPVIRNAILAAAESLAGSALESKLSRASKGKGKS